MLEGTKNAEDHRLSIHHWAEHGITGRGVLLDVARYAEHIGLANFDPYDGTALTVQNLMDVVRLEAVRFKQADILLVRLGATKVSAFRTWLPGVEVESLCNVYFFKNYLARSVEERNELKFRESLLVCRTPLREQVLMIPPLPVKTAR